MIKILIISSFIKPVPDVVGGAVETLLTNLIMENEKNKDFVFHVISMKNESAMKMAHTFNYASFSYFNEKHKTTIGLFFFRLYLKILFHIDKNKTDAIFKRQDCTYLGYKTFLICRRFKPKYILFENYDYIHRFWHSVKRVGIDNCFFHIHSCIKYNPSEHCFFSNVISVSNYCLNFFYEGRDIRYRNFILKNCANTVFFTSRFSKKELENKRQELGIKPDDFVLIYTGRIVSYKGVRELIESTIRLNDKRLKLIILGEIMKEDNNEENTFREFFKKALYLNHNIKYLGFISNEELPVFLQISDLQVMPSLCQEGAGLSAIEGMISGLPLIVTNSGGLVEYVNDRCAIILNIDDKLTIRLTKTLKYLMNKKDLIVKMSKESKKEGNKYSFSNYYHNFTNIFKKSD